LIIRTIVPRTLCWVTVARALSSSRWMGPCRTLKSITQLMFWIWKTYKAKSRLIYLKPQSALSMTTLLRANRRA